LLNCRFYPTVIGARVMLVIKGESGAAVPGRQATFRERQDGKKMLESSAIEEGFHLLHEDVHLGPRPAYIRPDKISL